MTDYLMHYGIKGMKWGRRRYQNEDGTLTKAGKRKYKRYLKKNEKIDRRIKGVTAQYQDKINYYAHKSKRKNGFYDSYLGGEYMTPEDAKREKEEWESFRNRRINRLNDKRPYDFTKNNDLYKIKDNTSTVSDRRKQKRR